MLVGAARLVKELVVGSRREIGPRRLASTERLRWWRMVVGGDWEALCDALRRENHAFMNDLQVITGWLQLGNSQRAMDYIEETKKRVRRQTYVMNNLGPKIFGLLCSVKIRAEADGVSVSIQDPGVFDREGWEAPAQIGEMLWLVVKTAGEQGFTQLELGPVPGPEPDRYVVRLSGGCSNTRCLRDALSALSPEGFRLVVEEVRGLPAIIVEGA
ncbi:MAG: Spo0B domain-containing protein [Ignavibacteriales bacterium]